MIRIDDSHRYFALQAVVEAADKLLSGEIRDPYIFWYNSMTIEQQNAFACTAELFAWAVYIQATEVSR